MEFKKLYKDLQLREQLRTHFCRIATANYYTGFSFHSQAKDILAFETRSRTNLRKSLLSQQ